MKKSDEYYLDDFYKSVMKYKTKQQYWGEPMEHLFAILEHRNKSHGYKKQNYCDNFYYITTKNNLAVIKSKGHDSGKALGELLIRRKIISRYTHEANRELNGKEDTYGIKGVIIKHNRVIDDIKSALKPEEIKYLQTFFDDNETCTMTIDKRFDLAYAPVYKGSQVYQKDLCSASSCMSNRADGAQSFYGNIPCCNVVRFEDKGEQVGRCIMYEWEGKRHFIRIYGKPEYLPTLYRKLRCELKPDDLFGRDFAFRDLQQETTITDQSTNMYLDGNDYGLKRQCDENGENVKYVMCTRYNAPDVNGEWNSMKSTSSGPVCKNFHCKPTGNGDYQCECCGCDLFEDDDDITWVDDTPFCSIDCAHECGWYYCDNCDEWGNENGDGFWIDDQFYCCNECAERAGWSWCGCCGEWHDSDTFEHINGSDEYWCDGCVDHYLNEGRLVRCEECSELFDVEHSDNIKKYIDKNTRETVWLCDDCFDPEYYDKTDEGGENVDKKD